jgi:hypothetical protein
MPGNADDHETFTKSRKKWPTRRNVLVNITAVGVSGALADRAEADPHYGYHTRHARRPRSVGPFASSAQQHNFKIAVDAFNNMAAIPKAQSPLWTVLDPKVVVFDVTFDHQKASGIQAAIDAFYNLVVLINGSLVGPTFNPWGPSPNAPWGPPYGPYGPPNVSQRNMIRGSALWIDTDGTGSEPIKYHFKFNGDLLTELHAR